jgi:lipoate-protein ligase B
MTHSTSSTGDTRGYEEAFAQQKALVVSRRTGEIPDTLVFTEHAPVYTIGMRKGARQHLIWNEAQLKAQGLQVIHSNRAVISLIMAQAKS